MKQLPLTNKQIEVCDFILRNNNLKDTFLELDKLGYSDLDNSIASKFLLNNKLITSIHPVILTDIGSRYSDKGIVKFINHNRRDDFLRSPIFMTFAIYIPIIISLAFGIINYIQNQEYKHDSGIYIKNSEIDSILNKKGIKYIDSPVGKFAIKELRNDTTKHIDKGLKIDK
jgi:hypothetical protein